MKQDGPTIPCLKCHGLGRVFLGKKYAEVFAFLRKHGSATSTDIPIRSQSQNVANNRLEYLRKVGLVRRRKLNRVWIYRPTK